MCFHPGLPVARSKAFRAGEDGVPWLQSAETWGSWLPPAPWSRGWLEIPSGHEIACFSIVKYDGKHYTQASLSVNRVFLVRKVRYSLAKPETIFSEHAVRPQGSQSSKIMSQKSWFWTLVLLGFFKQTTPRLSFPICTVHGMYFLCFNNEKNSPNT